jgi:hypothetical protein
MALQKLAPDPTGSPQAQKAWFFRSNPGELIE